MRQTKQNFSKKSLAFTLAEVLIVLGIIGNVALLVLPGLITNVDKQIRLNQWKHSYALVGEAINRMTFENGGSMPFAYSATQSSSGCIEAFSQYLKVIKTCRTSTTAAVAATECFDTTTSGLATFYTYGILVNGVSVAFESGGTVWIDVNGKDKGPNQYGKDIFAIRFKTADGHYWAYGTKNSDETSTDILSATCNPEGTTVEKLSCSSYYLLNEDQMK